MAMKHAVVEHPSDEDMHVTLFGTEAEAEDHAVAIALECTSCDEDEIRANLRNVGNHREGDWGVWLANATESKS